MLWGSESEELMVQVMNCFYYLVGRLSNVYQNGRDYEDA